MLELCAPVDSPRGLSPLVESPNSSFHEVIQVLHGTKEPPSSKFLSIRHANLDEDNVVLLAEALKNSSFPGGLRLRGHLIPALSLLQTLTSVSTATQLCLVAGCNLGDVEAQILAAALRSNKFLDSLELPGNGLLGLAPSSSPHQRLPHFWCTGQGTRLDLLELDILLRHY